MKESDGGKARPETPAPPSIREDSGESETGRGIRGVLLISLALLLPGILMHSLIRERAGSSAPAEAETPLGYVWSLTFYAVPVGLIIAWLLSSSAWRETRMIAGRALSFLIPIGVVMNLLFAGFFFEYPNPVAHLAVDVPVIAGRTPLEDYLFYAISFPFVTLTYVWADGYWLRAYHRPVSAGKDRRLKIHGRPVLWVVLTIAAATIYRRFVAGEADGFPGYLAYVLIVAYLPAACLFNNVRHQINWRAFGVAHVLMILVCLEWEATFAIPFGFWGFAPEMMTGIHLPVWHGLPIEQIFVWFVSAFVNVVIYEVFRFRLEGRGKTKTGC